MGDPATPDPAREVVLCEAPDPETADRLCRMLAAAGIEASWEGTRQQAGLFTHLTITLYCAEGVRMQALQVLAEGGVDVTSDDYRWSLAGFAGGAEHWARYKRQVRWGMVLVPLGLGLVALAAWLSQRG